MIVTLNTLAVVGLIAGIALMLAGFLMMLGDRFAKDLGLKAIIIGILLWGLVFLIVVRKEDVVRLGG